MGYSVTVQVVNPKQGKRMIAFLSQNMRGWYDRKSVV